MLKQFSKILTTIFLLAFIFQLAGLVFLLAVPAPSQAAEKKVYFVPQVGIGDDFKKGDSKLVGNSTKMIGDYINAIYKYAIGIVGILAAVVLMFGGVMWITAGGNAERIGNAKSWIGAALTGLVLTLASYTILYTVNPDLVNFKITTIQNVEDNSTGCCEYSVCSINITQSDCKKKDGYTSWAEGSSYSCIDNKCKEDIKGCCIVKVWTGPNYYLMCEKESMTESECNKEAYKESFKPDYKCNLSSGECEATGGATGGW